MHIPNNSVAGRTNSKHSANQLEQQSVNQGQQSSNAGLSSRPQFSHTILQLLLQLILQLLQQLTQPPSEPKPEPKPEPKSLDLSQLQQDNLKQLMGFDPNAPIGVQILDNDGSGTVSEGDTAIANGGITGGEISRKTLTADDVAQINQAKGGIPQSFTHNLQKWQSVAGGPDEFIGYTTQQSCFCPSEFNRPMNITESGGEITSATYADTNETVPDNIRQSLQTIDQRFEQLQSAYENGADSVNVEYDEQFGFPTSVFIDHSQMIADEEVSYTITNLGVALP